MQVFRNNVNINKVHQSPIVSFFLLGRKTKRGKKACMLIITSAENEKKPLQGVQVKDSFKGKENILQELN